MTPSSLRRHGAAVVFSFLPICSAWAQDVLWSPPTTPAAPTAVQDRQNNSPMQVFAPSASAPPLPLQLGPVNLHPHVDYQFSYGNGLQSSAGQSQSSIVQTVSPGMLFNVGDHWTLDYTPSFVFYSSSAFRNTVNHSVNLGWGTAYGDWFFSGSQNCSITSDPNIETGSQSDQNAYSTALNASYQFNDKMSVDMGVGQTFSYVGNGPTSTNYLQGLANSKSWSTMDWLNYQFWPRLNAGIGVGGGYTTQDNSPDAYYEQYQGRINWRATDKISFQMSGGAQVQQYSGGGASDLFSPIYNVTVQYQPFEQTRLSVTGSGTVSPASYQSQATETYGISGDLNQRLLGCLFLDLSGGYARTKYLATIAGLATGRSDDTYSFNARLSCSPLKRTTVSVFYAYSQDSSSQNGFLAGAGYGYTSNQVGFEIGYRY